MNSNITIDDLYSDAGSFDQALVLEALKGKVVFTPEHDTLFLEDTTKLGADKSILVYTLAKKVLKANGKIEDETVTPAEMGEKSKLNANTIRGSVMRLKNRNLFIAIGAGYEIPNFKVGAVLEILNNQKKEA